MNEILKLCVTTRRYIFIIQFKLMQTIPKPPTSDGSTDKVVSFSKSRMLSLFRKSRDDISQKSSIRF